VAKLSLIFCNSFFKEKVRQLHTAIQGENIREVQQILDRKKYIMAADRTGLPPFHKAVLYGNGDMVEWFCEEFKFAIEHKDNVRKSYNGIIIFEMSRCF
jgi:hypothetical protein